MLSINDKIHQEIQNIPENLSFQIYDFVCFIKARYSYQSYEQQIAISNWDDFFARYTREVTETIPLKRNEIYAERLH